MDDTIGDNDGCVGGKRYFTTHDVRAPSQQWISPCNLRNAVQVTLAVVAQGQGLFLREESGRVTSTESGSAKIPEEMLEHMKYLFSAFDADGSGVSCAARGWRLPTDYKQL